MADDGDYGSKRLVPGRTGQGDQWRQTYGLPPLMATASYDTFNPREADAWQRQRVREAIGTACWAYQVRDESFEQQGHRMIAEALGRG